MDRFKPKGALDISALTLLPTLFLRETSGDGNQAARVGKVNRIREAGRDFVLEYTLDSKIPSFTDADIQQLADDLEIEEFEFQRTHWAIKNSDLFHVLLSNMKPRQPSPRLFTIADPEIIDTHLVSAMMPFHAGFAAVETGFRCIRAKDIWQHHEVIQDVVSLIDRSAIVICDCSDRNPNVFYEIGISHTLGRETILITQSDEHVPFDIKHLRYIKYLNNDQGLASLSQDLQRRFADLASSR